MCIGGIVIEDQREGPDQRIDSDLGQQSGEDRGNGDRGRVIGGRQPEEERKDRRLDTEGNHKDDGNDRQQPLVFDFTHGTMFRSAILSVPVRP